MKSSPIKYSFVRFANWLICFWFNIMIIHKSSLSSISNSVSISHGMSWLTHDISCDCFDCEPHHGSGQYIRVLWPQTSVSHLMIVSWRECPTVWELLIKFSQVCHHHWSGLCQHFKCAPHFCLQVVVVCLLQGDCCKQNEFKTSSHAPPPDSWHPWHQTPCLQLQTKHPQSQRWCGHQHGGCYDGHYTRWREGNFPNIS